MPRNHSLRNHLFVGAREAARSALDGIAAREGHDVAVAFMNAGMAVEYLLRAVVANVAPALLFVPRNSFDNKFAAAMVRAHTDAADDVSWVIEGKSADFELVRRVALEAAPVLAARAADIEEIMKRRNAVAHMYVVETPKLRGSVTALVRITEAVIDHLGADPLRFWGNRHALATSLAAESENLMRVEVELKVREAQQRVQHLRAGLALDEARRVISTLESNGSTVVFPGPNAQFHTPCPACGCQAEVYVRLADDTSNLDALELVDWGEEGIPGAVLIPQEPVAVMLQCPVCLLHLRSEELQAAYPAIADLYQYEVEPRRGTAQEYDEIMLVNEPDWELYPHGSDVG